MYIEKTYCKTENTKQKEEKNEQLNLNKAQRNVLKLIYHKTLRFKGIIVTKSFCVVWKEICCKFQFVQTCLTISIYEQVR